MCGTQKLLSHSRHFFTLILGRWFERGDCAITPNLFIFVIPLFIFVIPIIRSLPPSPDKDPDFGIQLSDQVWGLTGLETDMMQIPHQAHKPQLAFYRPVPPPVGLLFLASNRCWQPPTPYTGVGVRAVCWGPTGSIEKSILIQPQLLSLTLTPSHCPPPILPTLPSSPQNILLLFMGVCVCVCVYVCVHAHAYVCVSVDVGGCVC